MNQEPKSSFEDPEIRSHIKGAIISILLLAAVLVAAGIWLDPQLKALGRQVYDAMGIPGLTLLVYLGDSIITPFPRTLLSLSFKDPDYLRTLVGSSRGSVSYLYWRDLQVGI